MAQCLRLHAPKTRSWDLIPGQGTRSHVPKLGVHMPQLKRLLATTKTSRAKEINIKKKKRLSKQVTEIRMTNF